MHAQTVCTRLFLLPIKKGPGVDEAKIKFKCMCIEHYVNSASMHMMLYLSLLHMRTYCILLNYVT